MTRYLFGGAAAMLIVGSSATVSHLLVDAPMFAAQAVRYLLAAVLLLVLARVLKATIRRPRGGEWWWLLAVAFSGQLLFNIALVRGSEHAEPAVLAVAMATVPIAVAVLGPLLERRPPQPRVLLSAVVVALGAMLVIGVGRSTSIGVGYALLVLVCEAAFTLCALPVIGRLGAWGVSFHSVWLGALMFAVVSAPVEGVAAITTLGPEQWAAVLYLAGLVTAVAFVCWYTAVGRLGSDRAILLTGLAPISAALTGAAMLGLVPRALVWVGIAVVIAGLALGMRGGRSRSPAADLSEESGRLGA